MTRALYYIIKVAVLVAIAIWLAERPGDLEIEWQGYVVETTLGVALLALFVLIILCVVLYRLWRGLIGLPRLFGDWRHGSRRERGYKALTQGLVAVAAGDPDTAQKMARKADNLLQAPPLTRLLSAQAAQLRGDQDAAQRYFEEMLQSPETEFLGLRGLLNQTLGSSDTTAALQYAQRAREISPQTRWVIEGCFELEVRHRKWDDALRTVSAGAKGGVFSEETARRHKAAIMVEQSREAETAGDTSGAKRLAQKAVGLVPDFVPAILRDAKLLITANQHKKARKLIERHWAGTPHPDLFAVYLDALPAGTDALARVRAVETLVAAAPSEPESLLVLAESELEARLWGQARSNLLKVETLRPTPRVYRRLAELERAESNDVEAAQEWLAKVEESPPDPTWVCDACGTVTPTWTAVCNSCGTFNDLTWRSPIRVMRLTARAPDEADDDTAETLDLTPGAVTTGNRAAPAGV
ncbi:heme biosynthesis HemY N-terminal domain-containing protein [Fodinicurvata sp. EGI_FJ10296]|uniref:heme biosynthesis protein HemY n=1 Tax=Fodinicurvata sp. EGI_FJ10296 TaxID=3231908 RepID=UPI0034530661